MKSDKTNSPPDPFAALYPNIAAWVQDGYVEIGHTDYANRAFGKARDEGGTIWEGETKYPSLHDALQALDDGIADYLEKNG